MKIWLAPSRYLPHPGGIESATRDLALALQRSGHHVTIVTHHEPETLPTDEVLDGLRVHRIHFTAPSASVKGVTTALRDAPAILRQLDGLEPPDVIHVHGCASQLLPLTAWTWLRHRPLVLTTHGEVVADQHRIFERSTYARMSLRLAAWHAAALTAPSRWTLDASAQYTSRLRGGLVIPNGIDRLFWEATAPRPTDPVVFTWGRLEPVKGFDRLIAAWPLVLKELPEAKLVIGGDGPSRQELEGAIADAAFTGALTREEVRFHLGHARAVVVPSRMEAFGLVAAEAAAAGRPVVHSGAGALPEVVGADFTADADDPQELAQQILRALRAPDVPVPQFLTWTEVARHYTDLYRTAVR